MKGSLNTIRKQTLQFQYNGVADGFALQKEVSDWCNFSFIPEIEQQLELINPGEKYLSIDKLEIEANIDSSDWKQKISDELISSLKQKLSDYKTALSEIGDEVLSESAKLDELILFYFENGYLPWWGKALLDEDFKAVFQNWINEEMSAPRAELISERLEQIVSNNVTERIINQVPPMLFFQLLRNIYRESTEILSQLELFFEEIIFNYISAEEEKLITMTVYNHLLKIVIKNKGKFSPDSILPFLYKELKTNHVSAIIGSPSSAKIDVQVNPVQRAWQELLINESKKLKIKPGKNIQEEITKEKQLQYNKLIDQLINSEASKTGKDDLVAELQEEIFIDNAGAVIFAAFIPALFEKLKLEKDGKLVNPELAALIVQYCVSGQSSIDEFELVLPKILCGLDIESPINTNTKLSEEQMNEANEMLRSLIEYWSILKDTSVDGLRESFLKRSGKLILANNEWLLIVDQRPYDMLLERIPWSISLIKLPWMENLLKTQWI